MTTLIIRKNGNTYNLFIITPSNFLSCLVRLLCTFFNFCLSYFHFIFIVLLCFTSLQFLHLFLLNFALVFSSNLVPTTAINCITTRYLCRFPLSQFQQRDIIVTFLGTLTLKPRLRETCLGQETSLFLKVLLCLYYTRLTNFESSFLKKMHAWSLAGETISHGYLGSCFYNVHSSSDLLELK